MTLLEPCRFPRYVFRRPRSCRLGNEIAEALSHPKCRPISVILGTRGPGRFCPVVLPLVIPAIAGLVAKPQSRLTSVMFMAPAAAIHPSDDTHQCKTSFRELGWALSDVRSRINDIWVSELPNSWTAELFEGLREGPRPEQQRKLKLTLSPATRDFEESRALERLMRSPSCPVNELTIHDSTTPSVVQTSNPRHHEWIQQLESIIVYTSSGMSLWAFQVQCISGVLTALSQEGNRLKAINLDVNVSVPRLDFYSDLCSEHCKLEELHFETREDNDNSYRLVQSIFRALKDRPGSLKTLKCEVRALMNDKVLETLAEALRNPLCRLESLHLRCSRGGLDHTPMRGWIALFQSLAAPGSGLKSLSISVPMGVAFCDALAESLLSPNNRIRELSLRDINDTGERRDLPDGLKRAIIRRSNLEFCDGVRGSIRELNILDLARAQVEFFNTVHLVTALTSAHHVPRLAMSSSLMGFPMADFIPRISETLGWRMKLEFV